MKKKDREELISIYEEAHYRAMKRLIDEQNKDKIEENNKEVLIDRKRYEEVFYILNILFWPWKISKKFHINNQVYDGILVFFVSFILEVSGGIIWCGGIIKAFGSIIAQVQKGLYIQIIESLSLGVLIMVFGSLFFISGKEFSKVTDSNKIYAYSSSLISLISCLVALVALVV